MTDPTFIDRLLAANNMTEVKSIAADMVRAHDAQLSQHISQLPPELRDLILDFTVVIKPGVARVDETYKPPWQLQIDRRTRKVAARDYYTNTTFIPLPNGIVDRRDRDNFFAWLRSLTKEHRRQIRSWRLDFQWQFYTSNADPGRSPPHRGQALFVVRRTVEYFKLDLEDFDMELDYSQLKVALPCYNDDGSPKGGLHSYLEDGTLVNGTWVTEEQLRPRS